MIALASSFKTARLDADFEYPPGVVSPWIFAVQYPDTWTKAFRDAFRSARGNKCERCGHQHDPRNGYALTIHHLDNNNEFMATATGVVQSLSRNL